MLDTARETGYISPIETATTIGDEMIDSLAYSRSSRGEYGTHDNRRYTSIDLTGETRLEIAINLQTDRHENVVLVDIVCKEYTGKLRGLETHTSFFPKNGHVVGWVFGFSASHLYEFDAERMTTADLLALSFAMVESVYPSACWNLR